MSIEFIGIAATQETSETLLPHGPAIDKSYVGAIARAHEYAGFDRVLVAHSSSSVDGFQVAAYIAHQTERLGILLAHRPGFVAPTLAARQLATLDQFSDGRLAVHIISGGDDTEQQRDGDFLSHDERYQRTDEYLEVVRQNLDFQPAPSITKAVIIASKARMPWCARRKSRICRSISAAHRISPSKSPASTRMSTHYGANLWPR